MKNKKKKSDIDKVLQLLDKHGAIVGNGKSHLIKQREPRINNSGESRGYS